MRGVVRTRDLFFQAPLILRTYGLRAFCRCLLATVLRPGHATFLHTVWERDPERPPS